MCSKELSDKELYDQLKKLVEAANNEAERYKTESSKVVVYEDYENYRDWCYQKIWGKFWKIENEITVSPEEESFQIDSSYYDDITARMRAYEPVEWLMDVLN